MSEAIRVLVIDDDKNLANATAEILGKKGHAVTVATSGKAGATQIEDGDFDVVLTDLRMNDLDGLAIVKLCREKQPEADVYVITGSGDVKTAVEAMKLGATHYLIKPLEKDELRGIVEKSAEKVALARSNRDLRQQLDEKFGYEGVVGNSPGMRQVMSKLKAFAPTIAPVLILGENGTGKELAAKALHVNSPRKAKPYVAMNCAALNENLLDDEMFGHVDGAFTGSKGERKGRFEYASGGTLFLDEIGDMPLTLQSKLLRVLENGEVVRIGANAPIKVDVRIIAATNKDMDVLVKENKFRVDLLHRLKVGVIKLPALRERTEDLPLLTNHFLKELTAKYGKPVSGVSDPVRKAFAHFEWPGNVRQLRNVLESMLLLDHDGVLGADDVPDDSGIVVEGYTSPNMVAESGANHLIGKPMSDVERYYTERALELTDGNRHEAARMLGISERTLYRKIQEWKGEVAGE
ncbi:sigma-54 dependent transcriptional regulator [soil metagenome]